MALNRPKTHQLNDQLAHSIEVELWQVAQEVELDLLEEHECSCQVVVFQGCLHTHRVRWK